MYNIYSRHCYKFLESDHEEEVPLHVLLLSDEDSVVSVSLQSLSSPSPRPSCAMPSRRTASWA